MKSKKRSKQSPYAVWHYFYYTYYSNQHAEKLLNFLDNFKEAKRD